MGYGPLPWPICYNMGSHMKTTVDLPDDLMRRAKERARAEKTTLRALLTEGLRRVLGDRRRQGGRYRLKPASFKGEGLQPHVQEGSWEHVRDLAYEGRGS